jgi:hypothetical protein
VCGIADERLNGRDKRPRDKQEIEAEDAHEIKQCVESRDYFAPLNGRNVLLRQPYSAGQVPLVPMMCLSRLNERTDKI